MRYSSLVALLHLSSKASAQKIPVSDAMLQSLTRYAAFASAAYSSDCAAPPYGASVVQYFNNDDTDTQATLFQDDSAQEFILAFRGTSTLTDFETDYEQTLVTCDAPGIGCASDTNCTCGLGVLTAYQSINDDVFASLSTNMASTPSYNLVITGHSLGGGLSSIASISLRGQGISFNTTYSYGQPRTGNQAYADYVDSIFGSQSGTFYRATHTYDGVPQIPPTDDGYIHHHTEYWQSADPSAATTTYECTGQEPADCNQSTLGLGLGDGVTGINAAHLEYFGISIGNPLDPDAACDGTIV